MSHVLRHVGEDWDPRSDGDSKWGALFPGALVGIALVVLLLLGLLAFLGMVP